MTTEAKLVQAAKLQGVSLELYLKRMLEPDVPPPLVPRNSLYGFLKDYGPAPSLEDIREVRAEMFGGHKRL